MRDDLLRAHTKYTELRGTAAADWADPPRTTFEDMFTDAGLNFDEYTSVAYSFSIPEATRNPARPRKPNCYLVAHCVARDRFENGDVEDAAGSDGSLPVDLFYLEITFEEFVSLFKRLEVMLAPRSGSRPRTDQSYAANIVSETVLPEEY